MGKRMILLLGGARSGKSTHAEQWAMEHGKEVLYVATAQAYDDEMRDRIAKHKAARPANWQTVEAPHRTGEAITAVIGEQAVVLVDCLTVLTANALLELPDDSDQDAATAAMMAEVDGLLAAYEASDATWLIVSNEVGMGVVPPSKYGRLYRDGLGRANQRMATIADEVLLLVAGLPWQLKG